jgi:putative phosphoribosyl transferase
VFFRDRKEAGERLVQALLPYKGAPKTVVLGLPRGGVVVAAEVARVLDLPLDVIVPRKIGAPDDPEFAIGAIALDAVVLDRETIAALDISPSSIEEKIAYEKKEAERRLSLFRKGRPPQNFEGQEVILVDDGAALLALKSAAKTVVAVPVSSMRALSELKKEADEVICLSTPEPFYAVGQFYETFTQTTDEEVVQLLSK